MSAAVQLPPVAEPIRRQAAVLPHSAEAVVLEFPSVGQRIGYLLANPWKNYILPAAWLRRLVARSRSPLIAESRVNPGGWRSMEIIYRNAPPVDWFDRQALCDNSISMAARNRRKIVTAILRKLIARYGAEAHVTILGVGAGPGRHVQSAIVESGIDPQCATAYLVDRDPEAFAYGERLASRWGISERVRFLHGDAREIRRLLPDAAPQIIKLVGIVEYLSDDELVDLLRALREIAAPGASLVTHGLVDAHGTSRFLTRVFNLRHRQRTERQMTELMSRGGFRTIDCVFEPAGVYPILTAVAEA